MGQPSTKAEALGHGVSIFGVNLVSLGEDLFEVLDGARIEEVKVEVEGEQLLGLVQMIEGVKPQHAGGLASDV